MFRIRCLHARDAWLGLALLAWPIAIGCGASRGTPLPKTYPVSGKVFYKGGYPVSGGVIQFQSDSDPSLTRMGEIGPDGTFELVTLFQNERLQGATVGRYHVTVIPRMSDNTPVPIFQLPRAYTVTTEDNYFSIEVERMRDRSSR
jgi:hypothetical protein